MIKLIKNKIYEIIYYFKTKLIYKIIKKDKLSVLIRIADSSNYLEKNKKINSVIFWTTHKCASTYVSKFLKLGSRNGFNISVTRSALKLTIIILSSFCIPL